MVLFMAMKQIVDMLYQFKFLDYVMVIFAFALVTYGIWKSKLYKNLFSKMCLADFCVLALMIIFLLAFCRKTDAYAPFFKMESAFLVYFLGRIYAKNIHEAGKWLAGIGYVIIYANLIYRFYQFGCKIILIGPEAGHLNDGGFYYYKTDLAVAVIIANIFIYHYGKNTILKVITMFPITAYMVYYSGARGGKVVLTCLYIMILITELKKRGKMKTHNISCKRWYALGGVVVGVMLLFFVGIQYFPFDNISDIIPFEVTGNVPIEVLFHGRHMVVWDILHYFREQDFLVRLLGIDFNTESLHNTLGIAAHSAYIRQLYTGGYLACFALAGFVLYFYKVNANIKNNCVKNISAELMMMLLIYGLVIESLTFTQMSWFPMIYAGAAITIGLEK